MNERIRELVEQAGYTKGHHDEYGRLTVMPEFNKEKFAELIVRDCMILGFNAVYEVADDSKAFAVYQNIKEHFGVEE